MSIEIGDRLKWIETIYGKQSSDVFFVEGADDITDYGVAEGWRISCGRER